MSAEILRRAAALMREVATAATEGPWAPNGFEYDDEVDAFTYDIGVAGTTRSAGYTALRTDAEHMASWHPAVALAVADWMDVVVARHASLLDAFPFDSPAGAKTAAELVLGYDEALAVARAYLRESE